MGQSYIRFWSFSWKSFSDKQNDFEVGGGFEVFSAVATLFRQLPSLAHEFTALQN
ncbi:hypothetical protein VC87395_000536 [Vibrio paracholerae 87395]|nr:hypothetical protein VC87395_000536 [Vibrio paracholerae 87395]EMQ08194.1 hypothetical protein VCEC0009_000530 [Vibrio cholerae O1 str. EC-0009]